MELKVKHYVDDETLEIVASKHYINDEEVTPKDYMELLIGCIESDEDDEFEGLEECEGCEDECNDCDECEDEDEDEDDDDAEFEMICAWADAINDNDLCPDCVYQVVQDAYYTAKKMGYREAQLEMIENLFDEIEYLDE